MNNVKNILLGILAVLLVLSVGLNIYQFRADQSEQEEDMQTEVEDVKTVAVRPQAKDSVVIRYEVVRLPAMSKLEPAKIANDSVVDTCTIAVSDSVDVEIPISQKVYADSTYRAVISGYNVSLDSITVHSRVITNTITISKPRQRTIGIGINAGYGVGKSGLTPYIGIGVQWNIFNF